jgi:hypothetical protein
MQHSVHRCFLSVGDGRMVGVEGALGEQDVTGRIAVCASRRRVCRDYRQHDQKGATGDPASVTVQSGVGALHVGGHMPRTER